MRVFVDANVLISVLNKEYPAYLSSSKILSLAGQKGFSIYVSAVTLAIAFYFAEKKHGTLSAKKRIRVLLEHIHVSDCGEAEANEAVQNVRAHDFEDALQYYSAINGRCSSIVTFDTGDYYFSELEVLEPETFLQKYSSLLL